MDKHAQEKDEKNEEHRSLPLQSSSHSPVKLKEDLEGTLKYISLLEKIDTEGVAPCNHVLEGLYNAFREDTPGETTPREVFLKNAPEHIGGMIRVPQVIKSP